MNYNNNWTPNNEANLNRNVNFEAAEKDPDTIAARKARDACYESCGEVPLEDTDKIKVWQACYNECLKKVPYTAAEKRLLGGQPWGGRRGSRKNRKASRKNRKASRSRK